MAIQAIPINRRLFLAMRTIALGRYNRRNLVFTGLYKGWHHWNYFEIPSLRLLRYNDLE